MRLESLSARYGAALAVPVGWRADSHAGGIDLDLMPLLALLVDERNPARGAAAFHATLLAALEAWVVQASRRYGIRTVVLAGGCFANRQLAFSLPRRLAGADSPFSVPDRRRATTARSPWGKAGWQAGTCSAAPEDLAAAGRRVMRAVRCQVRLWCRISCSCHADCWPARSHGRAFCGRLDPSTSADSSIMW